VRIRVLALIVILAVAPAGAADAKRRHHHKRGHHPTRKHVAKPAPTPEPSPQPPKPSKFDGSCDLSGKVMLTPPLTNTPQPVSQHALALGSCSGTFTDGTGRTSALDKAPVTYAAESSADAASCLDGTATGAGQLLFPGGTIAFGFSETRLVATPLLRLTGKAGGEMDALATPSPSVDPVAAVQDCNGSGLKAFAFDAHFQTTSPISG
jgi:hypothetical protein